MKTNTNRREDSGHIPWFRKAAMRSATHSFLGAIGLACMLLNPVAFAKPVEHTLTLSGVDWTSGGVAGVGLVGVGIIPISGVSGTVTQAFLYWHGVDLTANGGNGIYDNETVTINGNSVTGISIGDATTNCWGPGSSRAHRADVTAFVTGNGNYLIAGLASKIGHNCNGASLVVVFDDGDATNNRDLVFFEGNDSNLIDGFPGEDAGWHALLTPINYNGGAVAVQLHVADGQSFRDSSLTFATVNGNTTVPDSVVLYDGVTLPNQGNGRASNGALYDIHNIDITTAFGGVPGPVTLDMDGQEFVEDCLGLVLLLLDLEPGSAPPPPGIELNPAYAENPVGTDHTVTATVTASAGEPVVGTTVFFEVLSGPNVGATGSDVTDINGEATFTYTSNGVTGTDLIEAYFVDDDGVTYYADAEKDWVTPPNTPPDVSNARPSLACLWPPNHKFVPITIEGVTDAEGAPITIVVLSITSDEPTTSVAGAGGAVHSPDASGVGTSTASLRAERTGTNVSTQNGRVYEIIFSASDGQDSSIGSVRVNVPHDKHDNTCFALDNGQVYDATVNN